MGKNLRQRDAIDRALSERNRPTVERQAKGESVEVTTLDEGVRRVAIRMLDVSDDDRRRLRALPRLNRWAGETLRRVYLLAHREPSVTASYGANRRPGELPEHVAYAEALVGRCRREAGRHWPVLRAALIDDAWTIRDQRHLGTALRWLSGWWRRTALTDGEAWSDLVDVLTLDVRPERESDDGVLPVSTPSDVHLWLAMALTGDGLPADEVLGFADQVSADRVAILGQLQAWKRAGLVRIDGGGGKPVVWRLR
jgi:hypothetical protein